MTTMPSETVLLAEYERSHSEVDRLNRQIWITAQLLIPLSLAGISLLLNFPQHNLQSLTTVAFASIMSTLILLGWLKMAVRWYGYQAIAQHRMLEIEKELGMWCTRYELQATKEPDIAPDDVEVTAESEVNRYRKVPTGLVKNGYSTINVIRFLIAALVVSWVLLTVREFVLVVW